MNTLDRRRNLGPANAQELKFEGDDVVQHQKSLKPSEFGKFFIKTGTVKTCNGSSYIEADGTVVQTSVYGPRPNFNKGFSSQATLRVTLELENFVSLDSLKISSLSQTAELSEDQLSSSIQSFVSSNCLNLILLDKYPKSAIELFVDVLALNPGQSLTYLLAVILNGVNVALLDSGLNLRAVPACGYVSENGSEVLVNCCHGPNYDDTADEDNEEILGVYSTFDEFDSFDSAVDSCIKQAQSIRVDINGFLI